MTEPAGAGSSVLDRNRFLRAWEQALLRNRAELFGTVTDGTLKGSFLPLGNKRPFCQERCESSEAASLRAAALEGLASSCFQECWIDPGTPGKAWGYCPARCASSSARTSNVIHECAAAGRQQPKERLLAAVTGKEAPEGAVTGVIRLFQ